MSSEEKGLRVAPQLPTAVQAPEDGKRKDGGSRKHKRKLASAEEHGEEPPDAKKKKRKDARASGGTNALKTTEEKSSGHENRKSDKGKHSALAQVTTNALSEYLVSNGITIDAPSGAVTPLLRFEELPVSPQLKSTLSGFKAPTPIQACSWPAALSGKDVIGIAETGSGKTFAFGLPAIAHLTSKNEESVSNTQWKAGRSRIGVLIIAPTRELALQTHETLEKISAPFGIKSVCVFGGVSKGQQKSLLSNPAVRVLVGTPGRLLDLVNEGVCDLSGVSYLVLDEADRMLDKGFENDIRLIIEQTAEMRLRQTLMFSATWPESVRRLAATFLKNPVRITVGNDELTANSRVSQTVEVFDDPMSKDKRLRELLKSLNHLPKAQSGKESRILVFVLYKKEADRVLGTLRSWGYSASGIHGDLSQVRRFQALEDFKNGTTGLLVATDVAARGLDIPDVGSVINYSFPLTVEDYVHRIGRTGRGGKEGRSFTFFTGENHEHALAGEFAGVLRNAGADASALQAKFPMSIKKKEHSAYGAFFRNDIKIPDKPTKIKF